MDGARVTTQAFPRLLLLGLCLFCSITAAPFGKPKCGYESCNAEKPGMINLHLVPHTHDDVGWIMTVDQYYYRRVQWILTGIVQELAADPSKRFIYVEIAFFSRWFEEQNNSTRQLVNELVSEGRLEFILGGWCMNDEASTHYSAIIDQHKLGFEYLRNNFGDCGRPKIGWQIDPFGHSREQASLFAQFGFDGLFFGRLDYQDKIHRQLTKTMEHVWRGSPHNLGNEANLFTGVLPNGYNPPLGMCFDISCSSSNPKIKDDPKMHDYNVDKMVDLLIASVYEQATWYATDHLIATMGSDFNYIQAHMFFSEMDKLIKYVNARQVTGSRVNLLYSTPSCYLKELNNDNRTWTTKDDDFFPYADRPHGFWTGYFTSRPTFKYYARAVNSFFQTTKVMATLAKVDNNSTSIEELQRLAAVVGVAQHHDAISGTEKQAVTYDYAERLAEGVRKVTKVVKDVYAVVIPKNGTPAPEQNFCPGLNISSCYVAGLKQFQVSLYNSLSWSVQYMVRLPVVGSAYTVMAEDGVTIVPSDVLPLNPSVIKVPEAKNEIFFEARLPALGFKTFFVTENDTNEALKFRSEKKIRSSPAQGVVISGKYVSLAFDSNGHVKSLTNKVSGISIPLQQNFFYYEGFVGNNSKGMFQASGAYIFRPLNNTPTPITLRSWGTQMNGNLVHEVHQQFSNWISQVYRVYEDKPYVEVEWTVGPVPVGDHVGKEVITRYNVGNWKTDGTFYTDSNGREILKRVLNYRPTWDFFQTEAVAGNYFPVNAFISVKNTETDHQFTVMTDRSQGGTSLHDGDVELMLHRRLLRDDGKGVGEALNEPGLNHAGLIARGTHYLFVEHASQSAKLYRPLAKEIFTTPTITFSDLTCTPAHYVASYHTLWSGLQTPLPPNVHLLSMERFHINGPVPSPPGTTPHLMRFEHFYEVDEDSKLSTPVTFDIKNLFHSFNITDVHELSLGGNTPIEDVHRLQWRTENDPKLDPTSYQLRRHLNKTTVTLNPMEIVTLQVNLPN